MEELLLKSNPTGDSYTVGNIIDADGEVYIHSHKTNETVYINKGNAQRLISHFQKVFNL